MRTLKVIGAPLVIGAVLSLSACGSTDDAAVTDACLQAMETAAAELDPTAAESLIEDTLSACSTADEWLAALEQYPGALGLTGRAEIDDMSLLAPCYAYPDTPVCEDAAAADRL